MNGITQQKWRDVFTIRLKRIMQERNINGRQLAALTSLTETTISRYRAGRRVPDAYDLAQIAGALDCTADELISLRYDGFELAGFSTEEVKRLRELRDKYGLEEKDLIDTVKVMGPGLTKYERLDKLFEMIVIACRKKGE